MLKKSKHESVTTHLDSTDKFRKKLIPINVRFTLDVVLRRRDLRSSKITEIKKGSGWIIARSEIIIAEVTKFGLIPIFSHPYTHPVFQHLLWGGLSILEKRIRKTELDLRDNED